jgi:membrane protein involved in colicin uptake
MKQKSYDNMMNRLRASQKAKAEADAKIAAEKIAAEHEQARLAAEQVKVAHTASVTVTASAVMGSNTGDIFYKIRMRESGNNYATNTGNGYYGAYQYDLGTWANYGGYSRPDLAPPDVQDAKAHETYAARGCSPWPNTCY